MVNQAKNSFAYPFCWGTTDKTTGHKELDMHQSNAD